jgi:hypothetical protein
MRSEQDSTRRVRAWLEHGVTVLPDRVLDRVLDDVARTRQRRGSRLHARSARVLAAAAVLLAVSLGAVGFGQRIGDAIQDLTSDALLNPAVRSLASMPPGPLDAGSYVIDIGLPVTVEFELPEGWSKTVQGADSAVLTSDPDGASERPPSGAILGYYTVANLFADLCDLEGRMVDPPVGPTVEDLIAAFGGSPGLHASAATPASIAGYPAQRIELDVEVFMCPVDQAHLWKTPTGSVRTLTSGEELTTLWIVDVDGDRLVVDATTYPGTTDEDHDELQGIIDSIRMDVADESR